MVGLIYWYYSSELVQAVNLIKDAQAWPTLAGFLFFWSSAVGCESLRMWLAFRSEGLDLFAAHRLAIGGLAVSNLAGSQLGADGWRLWGVMQCLGPKRLLLVTFVALRLVGWLGLAAALALWIWLPGTGARPSYAVDLQERLQALRWMMIWIAVGGAAMTAAGAAWLYIQRDYLLRRLRALASAAASVRLRIWIAIFLISVLGIFARAIGISLAALALGCHLHPLFPVGLVFALALVNIVPLTPANLGVRELVFLASFTAFDQTAALALGVSLLDRMFGITLAMAGALAFVRETAGTKRRFALFSFFGQAPRPAAPFDESDVAEQNDG